MKPRSIVILATLAVLFVAASPSWAGPAVRVQVPFEFTVANVVMPAGLYNMRYTDVPDQLLIRQVDGDAGAYVALIKTGETSPVGAGLVAVLFHQYGDRYFLQQLEVPGYPVAKVHLSKLEKEIIAQTGQRPGRTLIAKLAHK